MSQNHSPQDDKSRKMSNQYSKNVQNQNSPNNMVKSSKYSSNRPYPTPREYRNNPRERSRSPGINYRAPYHNYPHNNMKQSNQNNYDSNNQRNRPYYRQQDFGGQRQFESKYSKNYQEGNNNNYYKNNISEHSKDDCLIILQKTYYNYILKDFDALKNKLKNELKDDISNIIYNYSVPNINENVFKFTTCTFEGKSIAIRIIAEYLFSEIKKKYENTTYLKLYFLVPDNVIGFIIGIDGKNINQIRDDSNAKIEVSNPNSSNYRKIEIAGDPKGISLAAEKIYAIVKKYFYFNNPKILNRNERDRRELEYERDNRSREFNYKDKNYTNFRSKEYNNNSGYKDNDYKGMYNKERNDYNMGYRNDYKSRGGDNYKSSNMGKRDYDGFHRNKFKEHRDNGPRYKNNYDDRNDSYYHDNNNDNRNMNDSYNGESKNDDNRSRKSYSQKSSHLSKSGSSYHRGENNSKYDEENYINKNDFEEPHEKKDINEDEISNKEIKEKNDDKIENKEINEDNVNNNNINDLNDDDNNNNNVDNVDNVNEENGKDIKVNNDFIGDDGNESRLCKITLQLSSEEINCLSAIDINIWNSLENTYHCNISKIIKNIDNQEFSLITFNGTPKQNSSAMFQLQKYLLEKNNTELNKI